MRPRAAVIVLSVTISLATLGGVASPATSATGSDSSQVLARGGRISGVARAEARGAGLAPTTIQATCSTPGPTNFAADCNSSGNPVNETWIATNGSMLVGGANDYNSYNGNADLGFYWSQDGKTWNDDGPLDLYPHDPNNAAGDPGLVIDSNGVVYYSGIFFSYVSCDVGGVELARRDPATGAWSNYEIAANSTAMFQDKPAIAGDDAHVFVSWTRYGSCTGIGVTSPIKVAVFDAGAESGPPLDILSVPGSTYSQGSSIATDGEGGFWVSWEEFPSAFATTGEIRLARFTMGGGWSDPITISPPGFQDLPSPLPGFLFRNNSFPMLAVAGGKPKVVWTSYDTGVGRVYLWRPNRELAMVSDGGDDQFFPSVAGFPRGNVAISWSQTQQSTQTFDQYLWVGGRVSKISSSPSYPNQDCIFGGTFIGDYNATVVMGSTPHPIWTDVRRDSPICSGTAQDALVFSP